MSFRQKLIKFSKKENMGQTVLSLIQAVLEMFETEKI